METTPPKKLDEVLQAYRVIQIPQSQSWRNEYWKPTQYSSRNLHEVGELERTTFLKNLEECPLTLTRGIRERVGRISSLSELVRLISDPSRSQIPKLSREVIYSTSGGSRPIGNTSWGSWNGLQVIDLDIKNKGLALRLKSDLFKSLSNCCWFLGIFLSSSGKGLHIYTKIAVPGGLSEDEMHSLFLINFRHKYSFVYLACLDPVRELDLGSEFPEGWIDLAMAKPQQGAFIGYDPEPLISTSFVDDFIYVDYDGSTSEDWILHPDLRRIFRKWEWFGREEETPRTEIREVGGVPGEFGIRIHYKHQERWKLANTLVHLFGLDEGFRILRRICSSEIPTSELKSDCITASRHSKPPDPWAVGRLNTSHNFKIKLKLGEVPEQEESLLSVVRKLNDPNTLREASRVLDFRISSTQYLSDLLPALRRNLGRITLLEAGPGLGKTEMVKEMVREGTKIMMVMPFTSTIKSKVEREVGWTYSYGSKNPKLGSPGYVLTLDKFSRLSPAEIKLAGYELVVVDESHLLFMSEYRSIMARVVRLISQLEVRVILMSGTPSGELVFFPEASHIRVRRDEVREKTFTVHLLETQDSQTYLMCEAMADALARGKRIIYPTNEGLLRSRIIEAGVNYFLERNHALPPTTLRYYKKSEVGEKFMDDINFKKTIRDIGILMCTSYLSVGVDILDKLDFEIFFGNLFSPAEIDQWANRVRKRDLHINLFVSKRDSEGNPRRLTHYSELDFTLSQAELRDVHSLIQICNNSYERNRLQGFKYNTLVSSILESNHFIVWDEERERYVLDELDYKIVMFERKYRAYLQQLPIILRGMEGYGYGIRVDDEKLEAPSLAEFKAVVVRARGRGEDLNSTLTEDFLECLNPDLLGVYRDVLAGKLDLKKSTSWGLSGGEVHVRSIEIFEKLIPIILSLSKTYDLSQIREIFKSVRNPENGRYNISALNRIRTLITLLRTEREGSLDLPIIEFVRDSGLFIETHEKCPRRELRKFLDEWVERFLGNESTRDVPLTQSQLTIDRISRCFETLFRCLIQPTRLRGGHLTLRKFEVIWKEREQISEVGVPKIILDFMGEP